MRRRDCVRQATMRSLRTPVQSSQKALLVLSYRTWMKRSRANLPEWRNGLGLTSLVLVALSWLWYALVYALGFVGIGFASLVPAFVPLTSVAVSCALLAALLGSAWQGRSRIGAVGASVLMTLGYQSFGYW